MHALRGKYGQEKIYSTVIVPNMALSTPKSILSGNGICEKFLYASFYYMIVHFTHFRATIGPNRVILNFWTFLRLLDYAADGS